MTCHVYILQSEASGRYYVGSAKDVEQRLARHNAAQSLYTKGRGPWRLVHLEEFPTRAAAVKREYAIKRMKSRAYIEELIRGLSPS